MRCPRCCAPLGDHSTYCARCGYLLTEEDKVAQEREGKEEDMQSKQGSVHKSGMIVGAAVVVVAILLALMVMGGCSSNEAPEPPQAPAQEASSPEPEGAPEPEPEPEPAKLDIPNQYFLTGLGFASGGGSVNQWGLEDLEGNQVPFEIAEMMPMGGFAEGRIFVTWETSEYDEEWETEFNEATHYALLDQTGKIVKDLTDLVDSFSFYSQGFFEGAKVVNQPIYVDGRMVLCLEGAGSSQTIVVLDEQGNVVFTVGDSDRYRYADEGTVPVEFDIDFDTRGSSTIDAAYHDGVLCIDNRLIVDPNGIILAQNEDHLESLGNGYMMAGFDATAAVDYSGNVVFDPSSLNVEGDIEDAEIFALNGQPGASGIVSVQAEKVNPHGGENKDLKGLYCISTQKWLVPLQEGDLSFSEANEGMIWVSVESKNHILEGYGATDDDENSAYSCLMDVQGNIVVDDATAGIEEDGKAIGGSNPYYLQEGYWVYGSRPGVVVLIENGVIKGTTAAPEHGIGIGC